MRILIKIATSPRVADYITSRYGVAPLVCNAKPELSYILNALERNTNHQDTKSDLSQYTSSVFIATSYDQYARHGFSVSATTTNLINKFFEKKIREQLFIALDVATSINKKRGTIKKAILAYCDNLGLDPNLFLYDSLKRAYLRHRNQNISMVHLSP